MISTKHLLCASLALLILGCSDNDSAGDHPEPASGSAGTDTATLNMWDSLGYGFKDITIAKDLDHFLLGGSAFIANTRVQGGNGQFLLTSYTPFPKDDGSHWGSQATSQQFKQLLEDNKSGVFITRLGAFASVDDAVATSGTSEIPIDTGFVSYAKVQLTWTFTNPNISQTPIVCNLLIGRYWALSGLNNWRWAIGTWGDHTLVPNSDQSQGTVTCENGKKLVLGTRAWDNDHINVWPLTTGG